MSGPDDRQGRRAGFTQIEPIIMLIVLGMLTVLQVPRLLLAAERATASEAFVFLSAAMASQERYNSMNGTYSSDLCMPGLRDPVPPYFTAGPMLPGASGDLRTSWSLTLTRSKRRGFGSYTVVFTEAGYDQARSSIQEFPLINPYSIMKLARR